MTVPIPDDGYADGGEPYTDEEMAWMLAADHEDMMHVYDDENGYPEAWDGLSVVEEATDGQSLLPELR